ncbi:MAG: hypothetical protein KHW84_12520 [Enterobacter cloacae]|nr:hypothetical protein [Enterobacter cloacae]
MTSGKQLLQSFISNDIEAINAYGREVGYSEFTHYLRNEKLLLSYLHMKTTIEEAAMDKKDLYLLDAYNEIDEFIQNMHNTLCSMPFTGRWSFVKGIEYSAYYPAWMRREVRDMDVIFEKKNDYQYFLEYLEKSGFAFKFLWVMKPQHVKVASALAYTDKQYGFGYKHSDKLWVEAHLHSFPISYYAAFDFFEAKSCLSHNDFMIALILAEFANRDGVEKNYSIRDVMDFHFLLEGIHRDKKVSESLVKIINDNALDISLMTFKNFILKENISFPNIEGFYKLYNECVDEVHLAEILIAITHNSYKYERDHGLLYASRNNNSVEQKKKTIFFSQHIERENDEKKCRRSSKEKLNLLESGVPISILRQELNFYMDK